MEEITHLPGASRHESEQKSILPVACTLVALLVVFLVDMESLIVYAVFFGHYISSRISIAQMLSSTSLDLLGFGDMGPCVPDGQQAAVVLKTGLTPT